MRRWRTMRGWRCRCLGGPRRNERHARWKRLGHALLRGARLEPADRAVVRAAAQRSWMVSRLAAAPRTTCQMRPKQSRVAVHLVKEESNKLEDEGFAQEVEVRALLA